MSSTIRSPNARINVTALAGVRGRPHSRPAIRAVRRKSGRPAVGAAEWTRPDPESVVIPNIAPDPGSPSA